MNSKHFKCFISLLYSVYLLISCGGGGGSGMVAGGGIGGTGIISSGVVTGFGSVVVNGSKFDTSNAAVIINGEQIGVGDEFVLDNLDIGRVVTVEGTGILDDINAKAVRVIYQDNVRGPVERIELDPNDPATKKIVVLGQTVIVNVITKFKNTEFDDITVDDVVAVSGYLDNNGDIRATFLEEIIDITAIFEVTGFVEGLDIGLETFLINGLEIDYSAIAANLPQGIPADGLFVEVEGELAVSGAMLAMSIELADELGGDDGDEVEIMGFVTNIISENGIIKFQIGNQEVHVDSDPEVVIYVDGDPSDIAPGQKLEAEGSLVDGILVADEIEFWQPDQIEVEGVVTEVDLSLDPIEFSISNQDGDQVVEADTDTTIFDGVTPEEIAVGMNIEVKGVPLDNDISVLIADKVSLELD